MKIDRKDYESLQHTRELKVFSYRHRNSVMPNACTLPFMDGSMPKDPPILTMEEEMHYYKTCTQCLETKNLLDYYRRIDYRGRHKYFPICRTCQTQRTQDAKAFRNQDQRAVRARIKGFGSFDEWRVARQDAVGRPCPICGQLMSDKGYWEAVWLGKFVCKKCAGTIRHYYNCKTEIKQFIKDNKEAIIDVITQ